MSGRLADFRIIQLATHTFYSAQSPNAAAVVLWSDKKGHEIEGLRRIRDIESLDFHSDLVILSSCSSAQEGTFQGREWWGLRQALLSAGSSGVVISLGTWRIREPRS